MECPTDFLVSTSKTEYFGMSSRRTREGVTLGHPVKVGKINRIWIFDWDWKENAEIERMPNWFSLFYVLTEYFKVNTLEWVQDAQEKVLPEGIPSKLGK